MSDIVLLAIAGGAIGAAGLVLVWYLPPVVFISAGIGLSVFSGHWQDIGLPTGPDRLLLLAGLLGAVIKLVRRDGPDVDLGSWRIVLLTVAGSYAVISAIATGTITDRESVFALLDKFGLIPFVLFLLSPVIFRTEGDRRIFLGSLVALGAYLGIDSFLEVVGPRSLVYPRYIVDPNIGIHAERTRGPFAESVGMGLALYICIVATTLWGFLIAERRRARVFASIVVALLLLGVLGTVTRNAWVATIGATIIALGVAPTLRKWLAPLLGAGTVVVGVALVSIPGLLDKATSRAESERPLWDRYNSNRAALNMFKDQPLFGQGWGSFRTHSEGFYQIVPDYPLTAVSQVHNVVLSHFAELGVIGGGLWVASFLTAIAPAFWFRSHAAASPWRTGLIAIAASFFIMSMFAPLGYAFPNAMVWTWAGLAWMACSAPAEAPTAAAVAEERRVRARRSRWLALPARGGLTS